MINFQLSLVMVNVWYVYGGADRIVDIHAVILAMEYVQLIKECRICISFIKEKRPPITIN